MRRPSKTPKEALAKRSVQQGDCRVWTGRTEPNGYGKLTTGGRVKWVHRVAWELLRGPIPDGMVIDHKCFNRACINVDHLRLATKSQNGSNRGGPGPKNTTGFRNVHKKRNRYRVVMTKNGVTHMFGIFSTAEEAAVVAETKRRELFGEFAGR